MLDLHRSSISLMAISHTMMINKTTVLFLWCTIHVNSRSCATFYQPEEIPVNLNSLLFSKTFLHFSETFLRVNRGHNDAVLKKTLDKVDPKLLLSKINNTDIHGPLFNWISSFLSNRLKYGYVEGCLVRIMSFLVYHGALFSALSLVNVNIFLFE